MNRDGQSLFTVFCSLFVVHLSHRETAAVHSEFYVPLAEAQVVREGDDEALVAAEVREEVAVVHKDARRLHRRADAEADGLAAPFPRNVEGVSIDHLFGARALDAVWLGQGLVGQRDGFNGGIGAGKLPALVCGNDGIIRRVPAKNYL